MSDPKTTRDSDMATAIGGLATAVGGFKDTVEQSVLQSNEEIAKQRKLDTRRNLAALAVVGLMLSAVLIVGLMNRRTVTSVEGTFALLAECLVPATSADELENPGFPIDGERCYEHNQAAQGQLLTLLDRNQRQTLNELLHIVAEELDIEIDDIPLKPPSTTVPP